MQSVRPQQVTVIFRAILTDDMRQDTKACRQLAAFKGEMLDISNVTITVHSAGKMLCASYNLGMFES